MIDKKELIIPTLMLIGFLALSFSWFGTINVFALFGNGGHGNMDKNMECAWSKYNVFSNSTEAIYIKGECHVPIAPYYYDTREICKGGFFGIGMSCYEAEESVTKSIEQWTCFKLKDGSRC